MSFKTKFGIIFVVTFICIIVILPRDVKSFIWACIAGWQIGSWGQKLCNHISEKYGYK